MKTVRLNITLSASLLTVFILGTISFAKSTGNSVDDGFDALEKNKGSSKTLSQGINGFDSLDKGAKTNASSGHGIDAALSDIEAHKAKKKAEAAEKKRKIMAEEAKKSDEDMKNSCYVDSGPLLQFRVVYKTTEEQEAHEEWARTHAAEIEEENRKRRAAKAEQRRICDEWKAAGPKANSESFKAKLRQQDAVIAQMQRTATEEAKRRDATIEADIKQQKSSEESSREAKNKADRDTANSRASAAKAKSDAKEAEREEKHKQWCMVELAKDHRWCGCGKYDPVKGGVCMK